MTTLAPSFFDQFIFVLAGNKDNHKTWMGSKLGMIGQGTYE